MPAESAVERSVSAAEAGGRLDVFLARQPEIGTRTAAKELIAAGQVLVDGAVSKAGLLLTEGQRISFRPRIETKLAAAPIGPEELARLRILYEDNYLLVIDKPPGIASHPPEGKRDPGLSIADLALAHCGTLPTVGGEDRPGIVHRLDKDTSGVMVLAKTEEAFHFVQSQFKARTILKEYRAICFGEPRFDSDYVERNITHHPTHPDRMIVVPEGGREAVTFYAVVERFAGYTHFRCEPKTGRTHQIRVHLTSIGHSLLGDRVYRSRQHQHSALPAEAPEPPRQCLHAHRLTLLHPRTHEPLEFQVPIPPDMMQVLEWLRTNLPPR